MKQNHRGDVGPRVPPMTTHPRDVVAVVHESLALDETALKQVLILFNRVAFPGLPAFRSLPNAPAQFAQHLIPLAEAGLVFAPDIQKSDDQDFKSRILQDLDDLFKPYGLTGEELLASRTDEKKALEIKQKTSAINPESMPGFDPLAVINIMQRMSVSMTRFCATQLRNLNNLDAHAVVSNEFSSLEQDDESSTQLLKILIPALLLPGKDVSWEQIIEYRNDPNSRNRFLDLRNWITDTAHGKLTPFEAQEQLEPVLKRFRKQMEIHKMETVTTALEAYITTPPDVLTNLLNYQAGRTQKQLCFFAQQKLTLLEGEAQSEVSEVAYALEASFLSDTLNT